MKHLVLYIVKREYAFLFKRKPSRAFFVCIYPFIIMGLLLAVFWGKVLTQIPVAVIDQSQGVYAREMVRSLRANQFLDMRLLPTLSQAFEALQKGEVYGIIYLDSEYDQKLLKRIGAQLRVWINNEYLLISGNLNKGINQVVGGLNAKYQRQYLAALGVADALQPGISSPIELSETVLYNPAVNYVYFLGLGLLPAVLQLFICLSVCYSLLWDVKTRHARRLRVSVRRHPYWTIGSKLGVYMVGYGTVILIMLGILLVGFRVPLQGSWLRVVLGAFAFIFLTASTALSIATITNNLRLALSICAMYAAPAFAYFGVSFPVQSMPIAARIWSEFMPGTHLNRIFVNELLRGTNAWGTWGEIAGMLALGICLFGVGTVGYARWIKHKTYWGPKL